MALSSGTLKSSASPISSPGGGRFFFPRFLRAAAPFLAAALLFPACAAQRCMTREDAASPRGRIVRQEGAAPGRYIAVLAPPAAGPAAKAMRLPALAASAKEAGLGFEVLGEDHILLTGEGDGIRRAMRDDRVLYLEEDGPVRALVTPGHLDRIDQPKLPLDGEPFAPDLGEEVWDVCVVDTGSCKLDDPELAGRIGSGYSVIGDDGFDRLPHGCNVAKLIAGNTLGVNRTVRIHSIKVLHDDGRGRSSDVIAGMQYCKNLADSEGWTHRAANLSLGGPPSPATADAVHDLIDAGFMVVVAAGNNGGDACAGGPANVCEAITVAASDHRNDQAAYFTNKGQCVDVWAPGVAVNESWNGTSFASPIACGVATVAGNESTLKAWAAPDQIRGAGDSPNLLVQVHSSPGAGNGESPPAPPPSSLPPWTDDMSDGCQLAQQEAVPEAVWRACIAVDRATYLGEPGDDNARLRANAAFLDALLKGGLEQRRAMAWWGLRSLAGGGRFICVPGVTWGWPRHEGCRGGGR